MLRTSRAASPGYTHTLAILTIACAVWRTGGRSPRSRSGHSGHGPHGDEVSPRRHSGSDSLSDGWLGGGESQGAVGY